MPERAMENGRDRDNGNTAALCDRNVLAGQVYDINGHGGVEVLGFIPTRHELIELAKYWALRACEIEGSWPMEPKKKRADIRVRALAYRRIKYIERILGRIEVCAAVRKIQEAFWDRWPEGYGGF